MGLPNRKEKRETEKVKLELPVQNYAKTAMSWAVAEGFFEGYGDGTLRPRASLTRAQMAKLLTILDREF